MEAITKQQSNLSFRAVTTSDLNAIVRLYQNELNNNNTPLTTHFGLPFYLVELDNQIVGYSYVTTTAQSDDYSLNTHIDNALSDHSINDSFIQESEVFFKNEYCTSNHTNLSESINRLVRWLNNTNF